MATLPQSDLEGALDFLRDAEAVTGPDPFPAELLDRMRTLVGCDHVSYSELDRVRWRPLALGGCERAREIDDEPLTDGARFIELLCSEHPVCRYQNQTRDFSPRKLSDFVTLRQLHQLELYADYYRAFGIEYQLDVGLPADLSHTKVFLFDRRSRDFDERDRLLLELLLPHLVALHAAARDRRVVAALQASGHPPRSVVVVGRDGSVDFTGTEARELLNRYLGAGSHVRLPQAVHDWFRRESTRLNGDGGLRRATCPLTVQRGERRLVVRLVSDVLLVREEPRPLTPREYEILGLVAEGRSNAEIAASLWLSTGTVRIHLQHIYAKLGVRSRTAALARARQLKSVQPDRS